MASVLSAGTVGLDAAFVFEPQSGGLPQPSSASHRSLQISDSPYTFWSAEGPPIIGERHVLANTANRVEYTVTDLTANPDLATYGVSAQGTITSTAAVNPGFGPLFHTGLYFDSPTVMAGELSSSFDCRAEVSGGMEASVCIVSTSLFSREATGPDHFVLAPFTAILDLRGTGQARWHGGVIEASGTDYVLGLGLSFQRSGGTTLSSVITVRDGLVSHVKKGSGDPFDLPSIGSAGSFVISVPSLSASFDYRSAAGSYPTQLLVFSAQAMTFIAAPVAEVPEPSGLTLFGSGVLALFGGFRHWARHSPIKSTTGTRGG